MTKKETSPIARTFTAAGHVFRFQYDLPVVRDIMRETGVNILADNGIRAVAGDLIGFAEYAWATCRKQAESSGITEDEFIRAITPQLDHVLDCWLEAIADFFDQIQRGGLARLARGVVVAEREDRADVNALLTDETAERVIGRQLQTMAAQRRAALRDALGEESESQTHGAESPN